jgi:hypothetical protein
MGVKLIKKLNFIVLPLLMFLTVNQSIEGVVVKANGDIVVVNSGTIDSPGTYLINSVSGLQALAEVVNAGSGLSGYTFNLGSGIELSGIIWVPIGYTTAFEGTFNGGGHTISNLKISGAARETIENNGLFGLTSGAMVTNFTLDNAEVGDPDPFQRVGSGAGAVIGRMNNSTLSNVTLSGTVLVIGSVNVGGFVGHNYASGVSNRSEIIDSNLTLSGLNVDGLEHVGGFLGQNDQEDGIAVVSGISLSANSILIGAQEELGGFVGENEGSIENVQMQVSNELVVLVERGLESGSEVQAGGFVGYLEGGSITNVSLSSNFIGVISDNGSYYAEFGGFVGHATSSSTISSGLLQSDYLQITAGRQAGGFIADNRGTISGTQLISSIIDIFGTNGDSDDFGGFVGNNRGTIHDSHLTLTSGLTITSNDKYVGGFVGSNDSTSSMISSSTVTSSGLTIEGKFQIGGIVGRNIGTLSGVTIASTTINLSSFLFGDSSEIGGFAGINQGAQSKIINSNLYSSGLFVTGYAEVGGFIGQNQGLVEDANLRVTTISLSGLDTEFGGFVGYNDDANNSGVIRNANVFASGLTIVARDEIGGFAGENEGLIQSGVVNVTNLTITSTRSNGESESGGFVGFNDGSSAEIEDSVLIVDVFVLTGSEEIGGFAGQIDGSSIKNSRLFIVSGVIEGEYRVGGFIGVVESESPVSPIGGVIPYMVDSGIAHYGNLLISASESISELGGFTGSNLNGTIRNARLIADSMSITGGDFLGGFVGLNTGFANNPDIAGRIVDSNIRTSYLSIDGDSYIGGFAGYHTVGSPLTVNDNGSLIENIYLSGLSSTSGLILTISGNDYLGGLIGLNESNLQTGVTAFSSNTVNLADGYPEGLLRFPVRLGVYASGITINGRSRVGGFVGASSGLQLSIKYETSSTRGDDIPIIQANSVKIVGQGNDIGGFAGMFYGDDLQARVVVNDLTVSGNSVVGGFVGRISPRDAFNSTATTDSPTNDFIVISGMQLVVQSADISLTSGSISRSDLTPLLTYHPGTNPDGPDFFSLNYLGSEENNYTGLVWGIQENSSPTLLNNNNQPDPDPDSELENTPPNQEPEVTLSPPATLAPSSPPRTTTRSVVREIFLTVSDLTMNVGDPIVYPVATAIDRVGFIETDVSDLIVRTGEIGSAVGSYEITYTVTSNGVTQSQTVRVRVIDTIPPVIIYTGENEVYAGETLEVRFETSDNAPGVVTIRILEEADTTKAGETRLVAIATDASGNTTQIEVPIRVLQEEIVVREVKINQASLLFVLNSRELDIDSTTIFVAVATTEPPATSTMWMPYTTSTVSASQANQFVFVKAQDASGNYVMGASVPLLYQSEGVRLDPIPVPESTEAEVSSSFPWGVLALSAAAVAGIAILAWQRPKFAKFGVRYTLANRDRYGTRYQWFSGFFLLFGTRREYDVLFYDGDTLVSEQRVKRGKSAEAPFVATWDIAFDEVNEDLIVHRVK